MINIKITSDLISFKNCHTMKSPSSEYEGEPTVSHTISMLHLIDELRGPLVAATTSAGKRVYGTSKLHSSF